MPNAEKTAKRLFSFADIKINGNRDFDIQVHNKKFYKRVLSQGSLGLGESYMDGWWDVKKLDQFFERIQRANLQRKVNIIKLIPTFLKAILINRQSKRRSKRVAQDHYDLGNDLYQIMLDKNMQYTCAYWKNAKTLDKAQENKLDLICKKLKLKPGMEVLELGSGFGALARYMAKKYKCKVTAYNISKQQMDYAKTICKNLPVKLVLADYREAKGTYDRVVSIGLMEHVGYKNYRDFIRLVNRRLKKDGIFLLHTIGRNRSSVTTDPWTKKYIFPGGMLPSISQIAKSSQSYFVIEDLHNFGPDYDKTLMSWHQNFENGWGKIKNKYGERFYRMWKYYLLSSAGAFRARKIQLWQFALTKGKKGLYKSIR